MKNSTKKPTTSFWIISILALLWNIMGVIAYLGQVYMSDQILGKLPEAEQAYFNNIPAWITATFAIAVIAISIFLIWYSKKSKKSKNRWI